MKMKRILIAATLLLGLVLAFLVGQHVVAPIRNKALGQKKRKSGGNRRGRAGVYAGMGKSEGN